MTVKAEDFTQCHKYQPGWNTKAIAVWDTCR